MTRALAIAAALVVAGCFTDHPPGVIQTGSNDCYTCHHSDYVATAAPKHTDDPTRFHRGCGDCHHTTAWRPALEGPHAGQFPRGGPHADVACLECHDPDRGPSTAGANTLCGDCHTGAHHRDPANPSSCLQCHRRLGAD